MPESPEGALRVRLGPSRGAALSIATMHVGAAFGALALPFFPWMTLIAGVALLLSLRRGLAHHAFRRSPGAVVGMAYSESTGWRLGTAGGRVLERCTLSNACVHPRLIVARFSTGRGRITVLVPQGATDPDEARRLRVAMRRIAAQSSGPAGVRAPGDGPLRPPHRP